MERVWYKEYRFSQFEELRMALMADRKLADIVQTIEFPPKRYFGQVKESTVRERKEKLGRWLGVSFPLAAVMLTLWSAHIGSHILRVEPLYRPEGAELATSCAISWHLPA